jgi:DNA-binding LytR/AlgR family response regulator
MIKAILADKEADAMEQMADLLAELWPELTVCGRAADGGEALHLIAKHNPQIAILEVRLPGICGMQVARRIAGGCQVVFTTSYEHYAVNAFDSGALDYLLKPVGRERLRLALRRAKRALSASFNAPSPPGRSQSAQQLTDCGTAQNKRNYLQWLCTQNGRRSRLISADTVCYFKADQKFTAVFIREGETLINKSIKSLAEELDPDQFWRIHRSTIVNVSQIADVRRTKTGRGAVRLKDRLEVLTVSRPYLHLFKKM